MVFSHRLLIGDRLAVAVVVPGLCAASSRPTLFWSAPPAPFWPSFCSCSFFIHRLCLSFTLFLRIALGKALWSWAGEDTEPAMIGTIMSCQGILSSVSVSHLLTLKHQSYHHHKLNSYL